MLIYSVLQCPNDPNRKLKANSDCMTTWETISTRFSPVKTCANRHGHRTRAGDDLHHVPQQNGMQMKTNITHFTIIYHPSSRMEYSWD